MTYLSGRRENSLNFLLFETLLFGMMNYNTRKDMEKEGFLFEVQRLAIELDRLIDDYDLRGEVVSIMMTGVLENVESDKPRLKAIYHYDISSREELEDVLDFIRTSYRGPDDDIDLSDLFDGTGISLN